MASFHPQSLVPFPKFNPTKPSVAKPPKFATFPRTHVRTSGNRARLVANSVAEEVDVLPMRSSDSTDHQEGMAAGASLEMGLEGAVAGELVGGFASSEGPQFLFDAFPASSGGGSWSSVVGKEEMEKLVDRSINAMIVLSTGSFAITKLLTIDHDYSHGWTIFEILRYAPQYNWSAYEEALKANPVLAKMVISGVVYSLGDWIAQCFEGKPLFEFDRVRMFRSGLVGFTLHGSLSHYYYEFCEALFPFQDWWVVPAKVAFDQTAWSALWNTLYYTVVALLRFESPVTIYTELKATFWPMLTMSWLEVMATCSSYYIWSDSRGAKASLGGLCRARLGYHPLDILERKIRSASYQGRSAFQPAVTIPESSRGMILGGNIRWQ